MITQEQTAVLRMCIEGFLYGKIINLYPAKEVQLFPGLGIYSGIFAMYLLCRSKESRTTTIILYALCLLYFLSTATVVGDLLDYAIGVSNNSICKKIIFYY